MTKYIFICLFVLLPFPIHATDIIPGKPQETPIAIVGGKVHTVSGDVFENGVVVFDKGIITAVGNKEEIAIPATAKIINVEGKCVYPGLIAAYTILGLVEIDAVRATDDTNEVGYMNSNAQAYTAYNTDSEIIPTVRSNGILTAHVAPTGNGFTGTSAIMMLDGWTVEDACVVKEAGVHLVWPTMNVVEAWWIKTPAAEQQKNIAENIKKITDVIANTRKYQQSRQNNPQSKKDLRSEAMLPIIHKKAPLFIHANDYKQIEAAIEFARQNDLKIIIVGGMDSWKLTNELITHDIPVILEKTNSLPARSDEDYDLAFRIPEILNTAGVKFCISGGPGWDVRNLPFQAGTAIAYGLNKKSALRSITLSAAEILNVQDKIGSIEQGKEATIVVSTGDILDMRSSHIEYAFIQGRMIDLDDRHKRLWRKYQEKYK